jgi:hypothetical protein
MFPIEVTIQNIGEAEVYYWAFQALILFNGDVKKLKRYYIWAKHIPNKDLNEKIKIFKQYNIIQVMMEYSFFLVLYFKSKQDAAIFKLTNII